MEGQRCSEKDVLLSARGSEETETPGGVPSVGPCWVRVLFSCPAHEEGGGLLAFPPYRAGGGTLALACRTALYNLQKAC